MAGKQQKWKTTPMLLRFLFMSNRNLDQKGYSQPAKAGDHAHQHRARGGLKEAGSARAGMGQKKGGGGGKRWRKGREQGREKRGQRRVGREEGVRDEWGEERRWRAAPGMGKSEGNGEGWRRESKWEFTGEDDPGFGTETRGTISQFTR